MACRYVLREMIAHDKMHFGNLDCILRREAIEELVKATLNCQ